MGALEAPQDRHRQESRTGTSRAEQTGTMAELGAQEAMAVQGAQEAMAELGAQVAMAELGAQEAMAELGALEAMADGLRGLGLGPLGPAPTAGTHTTPQKNFPGEVRGYQEPSGAKQTRQYKTKQERPPGPDRQDRTAHRNQKPSWAGLEAEASSGHDMTSGALTGSLSNRFTSTTRGQAARMASMATTRGAACPRRVSVDKTRQGTLKCSCGHNKTDTRHSWP